jgi:hypothetical protein
LAAVEPLPEVHGTWDNWSGPPQQVALPAVKTAVWRAEDGSLGLFLVNLSETGQRFTFRLDPAAHGGFPQEGKWLELTRVSPEGTEVAGYMPWEGGKRMENLEPKELLVYEVKPVAALPKAVQAESRSAQRARFDAWCLARGVTWEAGLPAQVAEGDGVDAWVEITSGGERGVEVAAEWDVGLPNAPVPRTTPVPPGRPVRVHLVGGPAEGATLTCSLSLQLREGKSSARLLLPATVSVVQPVAVTVETPRGLRAGETGAVGIRVTNHRSSPVEGTVLGVRAPSGWELEPGPTTRVPRVEAGESRTVWLRVAVPETQAATTESIEAFLVEARSLGQAEVLPPRPRAEAPRAQVAPGIDGALSEWTAAPALTVGPDGAANLKDHGGEADLSGQVRVMWDDACLYFAAEVTDQEHSAPQPHQNMWQGDCLQIAVRPGGPTRTSSYDGVHELGLALTVDGPELWQWMPEERVVTEGQVAVVRHEGRTLYEAAIPWSALGLSPEAGRSAGFSLTLNDNDGAGFRGWLEWSSGLCGQKDASRFGVLSLR